MSTVLVGLDPASARGGDDALVAGAAVASEGDEPAPLVVVVVITQQDLDKTEELDLDSKRRVALERAYPATWKRVESVYRAAGVDEGALTIDVDVRFAPVHLVRSQERIAQELLAAAKERGATRIVLGRHGRPDCVAEFLLARGEREDAPAGAPSDAFVVRLRAGA